MTGLAAITSLVTLVMIFTSCHGLITNDHRGTVDIKIETQMHVQTLEPAISMIPVGYHIIGLGPNSESIGIDTAESNVQIFDLAAGNWEFLASAENAQGNLVAQGSDSVTIRTGEIVSISMELTPINGTGTFDLAVQWDPSAVDAPAIVGALYNATGENLPLSFAVDTGSAVTQGGLIDAGYYTLVVQLTDNDIPVMGAVEVARIVSGAITSGTYDFSEINSPGGSVIVNISPYMEDPITVDITGQQPIITYGSEMTLVASAPSESTALIYTWYLNGESLAVGDSITLGAGLLPGYYRADVTAFTTDGRRAGSTGHQFTIEEG